MVGASHKFADDIVREAAQELAIKLDVGENEWYVQVRKGEDGEHIHEWSSE
jgi:hypothetical protein